MGFCGVFDITVEWEDLKELLYTDQVNQWTCGWSTDKILPQCEEPIVLLTSGY